MNMAKNLLEILQMNFSYKVEVKTNTLIKSMNNQLDTVEATVNEMENYTELCRKKGMDAMREKRVRE